MTAFLTFSHSSSLLILYVFSESPNTQIRFPIKFIIIPPIVAANLLTNSEQPPFETRKAAKGDSRRGKINHEKSHDLFPVSLAFYTKRPLPVPYIAVDDPCRIGADLRRKIGDMTSGEKKEDTKINQRISDAYSAKLSVFTFSFSITASGFDLPS